MSNVLCFFASDTYSFDISVCTARAVSPLLVPRLLLPFVFHFVALQDGAAKFGPLPGGSSSSCFVPGRGNQLKATHGEMKITRKPIVQVGRCSINAEKCSRRPELRPPSARRFWPVAATASILSWRLDCHTQQGLPFFSFESSVVSALFSERTFGIFTTECLKLFGKQQQQQQLKVSWIHELPPQTAKKV